MIESAFRADKLAFLALENCTAVHAILPVMQRVILAGPGFGVWILLVWFVLFHECKLANSEGGVKVL